MNALKIAMALAFITTLAQAQQQQEDTFGNPFRFTETTGKAVYQNICASCHMPDGRGATGAAIYPALRQNPRLAAAAYPIAVITNGQKSMPAFARFLTDRQIADVVDYIRHDLGNTHPGTTTPEDVKAQR